MSKHKDIIKQYLDGVQNVDRDLLLSLVTDDFEFERKGQPVLRGKEVLLAMIDNTDGVVLEGAGSQRPTHKIDRMIEEGDTIAVNGTVLAPLPDGGQLEVLFSDFVTFRGDRISRLETYMITPAPPRG